MKIAVVVLLAVVASAVTEGAFVGYNNRPMSPETLALLEEFNAQAEVLEQTGRPNNRLPFSPDMLESLRPKAEETNSAE